MSLSRAEIGAVVDEIRPALLGSWIQKVFQPTDFGIVLEVRTPGRTLLLNISTQAETARIHLQRGRAPNPSRPPAFCQFLRARIHGSRIVDIYQHEQDRIVECVLQTRDTRYLLIAELFGRGANVLLADTSRTILATLHPARERLKRTGTLRGPDSTPPSHENRQRFLTPGDEQDDFPVSYAIQTYYSEREAGAILETARHARLLALRKTLKKLARRVEGLEADLEKARRYRGYARYGELLKANLGVLRKGQEEATVVDYFDETLPTLSLPLDPAKTPQANMDDYFQKHRKFLTAGREIGPRLAEAQRDMQGAREEIHRIERGDWHMPSHVAAESSSPSRPTAPLPHSRRRDARKGPFRRFQSSEGFPIYIGRTAKENEELTHRFANSEDLWFHARGVPGSHVVVRLPKGTDPPPETIRDAATLALMYSDLKKSGKGEVIYTRKKWVKKAKGQAPGTVVATQEKSLFVQLDRLRLDRLKGSR